MKSVEAATRKSTGKYKYFIGGYFYLLIYEDVIYVFDREGA